MGGHDSSPGPPFQRLLTPTSQSSNSNKILQRLTFTQLRALESFCNELGQGACGASHPVAKQRTSSKEKVGSANRRSSLESRAVTSAPEELKASQYSATSMEVRVDASQSNINDIDDKQAANAEDEPGKKTRSSKAKSAPLFEFSNTEAIKQKVRERKSTKDAYNVHNAYKETGFFQWLAKHEKFDNCTLSVIMINALWISIDTDGNLAETILDAKPMYKVADSLFFIYFTVEVLVRFCAFEKKRDCLKDGWFKFDATLVTLYAFDPFVIGLLAAAQGGGGLNLPTAVLRLFRLARLSRLVRMLRSLPELMVMIKGMVTAAASVGYTLALLMIITYVFSIAFRNLVPPGSDIEEAYFSSVPEAMHNLIIYATFLDSLSDFILSLKESSPVCFIVAWIYISLASLTVMNMLIGVLCEVISAVAAEENESTMVDKINEKFGEIVAQLDENNDGTISWDEFQGILEYPEATLALESVNVDPEGMVDMAEDFFFEDGKPVNVTFQDFMGMVLDCRGGQQATVKDVMSLGKRFNGKFLAVSGTVDTLNLKLDELLSLMQNPQYSALGS
eukprot:gnl/TRDRNA2_/TRDRNA2_176591_c7_seq14.p1 gnl/TRDRNA2_/TRDRNA2_176591_c7~~gnl/TRDRNA2_/TRDRNA2_176591_c7_seq14.p1  ORF type:complete len:573 (+),score=112.80 gnl/TRDRNA2_/TRDRNA2_176591_c7_seq14:31-1719(+)